MEWSHIIDLITLLTVGGGLYALVTIQDKRMALMLDNIKAMLESSSKANAAWENLAKQKLEDISKLEERCDRKDQKIEDLYKEIGSLRISLDKSRTARATAEMLKCNIVACPKRIPPFGEIPEIVKSLSDDKYESNKEEQHEKN